MCVKQNRADEEAIAYLNENYDTMGTLRLRERTKGVNSTGVRANNRA
jgi:hypothetical protein